MKVFPEAPQKISQRRVDVWARSVDACVDDPAISFSDRSSVNDRETICMLEYSLIL
jgi:hypothetical protein